MNAFQKTLIIIMNVFWNVFGMHFKKKKTHYIVIIGNIIRNEFKIDIRIYGIIYECRKEAHEEAHEERSEHDLDKAQRELPDSLSRD